MKFIPKSIVNPSTEDATNSNSTRPATQGDFTNPSTDGLSVRRIAESVLGVTENGIQKPPGTVRSGFGDTQLGAQAEDAILKQDARRPLPFTLPKIPITSPSQSVTFSTRAIDNMSDIMDALNISASMSIKYGTIHGNGNASFVNESKVLDSQLNYVVSVQVNNNSLPLIDDMVFQPIDTLPPDKFTEVYGDSFISGFVEGGNFNAVISVEVRQSWLPKQNVS